MLGYNPKTRLDERESYLEALREAQKEYDVAVSCFKEAVDPELIDEAIYLMEAARKKYSYLLKKYKSMVS
ncbi:MAG TPA: DUF2508 family protein [Firmicutes bacterium]|nr:DUF2508 family protein [Candidatus Fermentithermobacillaceae bacterium]